MSNVVGFFFRVLFRVRVSGNFVVRFRIVTRASTCISSLSLRQVLGQGGGAEGKASEFQTLMSSQKTAHV